MKMKEAKFDVVYDSVYTDRLSWGGPWRRQDVDLDLEFRF